jgi:hypothetical protein
LPENGGKAISARKSTSVAAFGALLKRFKKHAFYRIWLYYQKSKAKKNLTKNSPLSI